MYDEMIKRLRSHNGWALNKTLDEAADAIEELQQSVRGYEQLCDAWETTANHLAEMINDSPKWIPVTERLPENIDEEVLVCNDEYGKRGLGIVTVAIYDGGDWIECWLRKANLVGITHWMPLPEPPKGERNDDSTNDW